MKLEPVPSNPVMLRTFFAAVPQSVVAVCGLDPSGIPCGMTASSFTPVSLDPPLVSIAVANTSTTWPALRQLPRFGISLLSHTQAGACRALAVRGADRFADLQWRPGDHTGAVFIDNAAAELECDLVDELPAGDHSIALLAIRTIGVDHHREPLVFHGSMFRLLADNPAQGVREHE